MSGATAMAPDDSIAAWLDRMHDRYLTGDYTGALRYAELILERDATHAVAARHAERCRGVLTDMLLARLGPGDRRVERAMSRAELSWVKLDAEGERLLALAESEPSLDQFVERSGLPRLDALKRLAQLVDQRVLALRDPR